MNTTITTSEARANLYKLVQMADARHEPILITGKHNNAVLVSENDWKSIQETLYIQGVPGLKKSIEEGLNTPVGECVEELIW
jgi:antitoxin YefM